MATLAQFRTRVSSKLGLDNTAASAEQTLIDSWVNEGVIEVLLALHTYVTKTTMATTVGVGDYTLDTSILSIRDIFVTDSSSQAWSLERRDPEEILRMRRATVAVSAPPRFYALNGADMLMIYPTPSEVDTFTVYYVPRPTTLSSGTDDPSTASFGGIPLEFHKLIEWWALSEGADFGDDGSSQNGAVYMQKFVAKVKDYRRRQLMKGGRLPRKQVVGIRSSPFPPNDVDAGSWE